MFLILLIFATTIAGTEDFTNPESIGIESTSWSARNRATIQKIYNLTVYPHNIPILEHGAAAVPTGLFNQQATGRVSPVGNFTGFDDSIEYFFALAPDARVDPHVAFYDAEAVAFTTGCARVAASLVYLKSGTVDPETAKLNTTKPTSTLSQVSSFPLQGNTCGKRRSSRGRHTIRLRFGGSTMLAQCSNTKLGSQIYKPGTRQLWA